ncbi:hypothetical protein E2C01_070683 [Portunus trituberculatus]|uniref:Uncharacterized protein n=1 Tax=Portunus trituberculatus TaxID=210409 RepID=A0A5B7I2A8_PORTR|nr:hypothetical protein [Portunus trituberculatus]
MESHYTSQDSKHDYLHPNLNNQKMYEMFKENYASKGFVASYSTYCNILKPQNISFHDPRKDVQSM